MEYGVDIHARYQAGISLPTLHAQGYSFVVTKASQGTSIPSHSTLSAAQFKARFLAWVAQARQLGMIPGLYHWLVAGDGAAQARFFHGLVVEAGGPKGMLIQLDCEDNASYADVLEWRDEWRRLTGGHQFLLYTSGWWWRPRGWNGPAITPYLWDSHYLTADTDTIADNPATFASRIPADWWTPDYGGWLIDTILQFTGRGDAGTLGNNVDLNATRLTREQLLALTGEDDDMALTDRLPLTADQNDADGYTVEQVLSQLHASIVQGRRVLGSAQTHSGGLPTWWAPAVFLRAELAAIEARAAAREVAIEAREVARDAGQTELIRGLAGLSGAPVTAEQLAALTAVVRDAAAAAGRVEGDRVLAVLARQEAEREAALRAQLAAETGTA